MQDCGLGTQGWNRYAYVGNRALSATDPTGYEGEEYAQWSEPTEWAETAVPEPDGDGFTIKVTWTGGGRAFCDSGVCNHGGVVNAPEDLVWDVRANPKNACERAQHRCAERGEDCDAAYGPGCSVQGSPGEYWAARDYETQSVGAGTIPRLRIPGLPWWLWPILIIPELVPGADDPNYCAREIKSCISLCSRAKRDPAARNIWAGYWWRCLTGCVSHPCQQYLDESRHGDPDDQA